MTINLIPFTEDFIPESGRKYLVLTEFVNSPLKTKQMIDARVTRAWVEKKKKDVTTVDVPGQIVTHISEKPIL